MLILSDTLICQETAAAMSVCALLSIRVDESHVQIWDCCAMIVKSIQKNMQSLVK